MSQQSTAIAPRSTEQQQMEGIKILLSKENYQSSIRKFLAGSGVTPEHFIQTLLYVVSRDSKLLGCEKRSLLNASLEAASLKLEPNKTLGHVYIVPFYNSRSKVHEATCIVGYKGMVKLLYETDKLRVMGKAVHENDDFTCIFGSEPVLRHIPKGQDRGAFVGAWATAQDPNGNIVFDFMGIDDIEKHRMRSQTGRDRDTGAPANTWKSDYEEMAVKTVVRRLFKFTPVSLAGQEVITKAEELDAFDEGYGDELSMLPEGSDETHEDPPKPSDGIIVRQRPADPQKPTAEGGRL